MAARKPLVDNGGEIEQLQSGDVIEPAAIDLSSPPPIGETEPNTVNATSVDCEIVNTAKLRATSNSENAAIVEYDDGSGAISQLRLINDSSAKGALFRNTGSEKFVEFAFQVVDGTVAYQSFLAGNIFRYTPTQSPLRNGGGGEFNYFLNSTRFVIGDTVNISVAPLVCESHLTLAKYTVATLPSPGDVGMGAIAIASNGRRAGEGAGGGSGTPVWCDGSSWRTYYNNSVVLD